MSDFDCQVGVEELEGYSDYLAMQELEQWEFEQEYNAWFDQHMRINTEELLDQYFQEVSHV